MRRLEEQLATENTLSQGQKNTFVNALETFRISASVLARIREQDRRIDDEIHGIFLSDDNYAVTSQKVERVYNETLSAFADYVTKKLTKSE